MAWYGMHGKRWSKLKKRFESRLAPCFQGRLQVHVTEYRTTTADIGRGWITLDGVEICSAQIPSFYDDHIRFSPDTLNFGQAVGEYINMSIDDALTSEHPIIQAFAFLDKKVGKRRLGKINCEDLHEFPRITFRLRCQTEGISDL